jgi:hypothetical protein
VGEADGYRLKPVRDARTRDERVKTGELAGAVGDAATTASALAAATERTDRARAALAAAIRARAAHGSAAAIVRAEQFIVRRRKELDQALDVQLRAGTAHRGQLAEVDIARGRLAHARGQRQVIERHFAQWRTERRKLAERRED